MKLRQMVCLVALAGLLGWSASRSALADTPVQDDVARCESLVGGQFYTVPNAPTQIMSATYVPDANGVKAYCDVAGYVNPTIGFGIWLPVNHWNGKYLVRGCGGSCGTVAMDRACKSHVRDGYACVTTDMGHKSTLSDNNWAANNLQGQIDFAFRATHAVTDVGKAIVRVFYKAEPKKSYFFGCSTGGRQAMVEAQRFPDDFDGIISIASATGNTRQADADKIAATFNPQTFNFDSAGKPIMTIRKVPMLHRAVIAKCDMNDGVKDGLIGDPRDCKFDPADIQCKQGNGRDCLTAEQVDIVRQIYKVRGMQPGSELNWINSFIRETKPGTSAAYAQSRGDPNVWPALYNASNPDLRQFKEHGGKLIAVQGWSDPQINPTAMIDYYELTTRTMGGTAATMDFFRQFMIPGMDHCSGGEGAYGINYIGALEDWVEKGQAPDKLIGVHTTLGAPLDFFNIDLPFLDPKYVLFSRPAFAYPKKAVYSGKGDPNLASSFVAR